MRGTLPLGRMLADMAAIAVLVAGAGLALGPAYGGSAFVVALGIGALVGALAAGLPALLRWPLWTTLPLALVGYLVFGGGAAVPNSSAAGILPTLESSRLLTVGVITSWKQLLTVATPVGSSGTLLLPAYLSALVLATAGVLVALRTCHPLLALAAPAAMAVSAALLGTVNQAFHPAITGTAVALAALLWAGWRRHAAGLGGLDVRRPIALALMLVPAIAAGVLLGPNLLPASATRAAAREVVTPPFDASSLPSPLNGYRSYVKKDKDKNLFTVSDVPAGGVPIRVVTLDTYNGLFYSTGNTGDDPSGYFKRVGDQVAGVPAGPRADMTVTVDSGYSDLWVPDVGYLASLSFTGTRSSTLQNAFRYNTATGAALVADPLQPGDQYRMTVALPDQPQAAQLAGAQLQDPTIGQINWDEVPPDVTSKAQDWAGDIPASNPIGVITAIQKGLQDNGWVRDGGDGVDGGHDAGRIHRLLNAKYMYGDAEQFSVAMALMLRSRNIPARVVMGFWPKKGGTLTLTGSQMTAWVEVPFAGFGWVAFNPNPDQTKAPPQKKPSDNPTATQPHQAEDPPPPVPPKEASQQAPKQPDTPDNKADQNKDKDKKATTPPSASSSIAWALIIALVVAVLVLLLPIAGIAALKRRRRNRLASGPPDQRIAGAWSHLLDTAADFGKRPTGGATRAEAANQLASSFARDSVTAAAAPQPAPAGAPQRSVGGTGVAMLARRADSTVFAPDPVDAAEADQFWAAMESELASMTGSQSTWRRLRARLSLASLRRR